MTDLQHPRPADHRITTEASRYHGRVVIVTGGAQGLGAHIARRVAEEGASVVLADVQRDRAHETAERLEAATGRPVAVSIGDLSAPGAADDMARLAIARFGRIDTLVNNAAALIRHRLVDFPEELMQKAVDCNMWTTVRSCKAVLPTMLAQRYGRIVNIGGEAWRLGTPFHTMLGGVGKGAMVGLTATLAGETAADGITVNCVSPGAFTAGDDIDQTSAANLDPAWTTPETLESLTSAFRSSAVGIGRAAHPSEVAAAVAFLGSPESSYITGQHLGASGGLAML